MVTPPGSRRSAYFSEGLAWNPSEKEGSVGTLYCPSTPGALPTTIALDKAGGSKVHGAATLASEECMVLALTYSDVMLLPPDMIEIPNHRRFAPERTANISNPTGIERTPSSEATFFEDGGDLSRRRQSGLRPRATHRRCWRKPCGCLIRPPAEQGDSPLSTTGKLVLLLARAASSIRGVSSPRVSAGDRVDTSLPLAQVDSGRCHRMVRDLGFTMVCLRLFEWCR